MASEISNVNVAVRVRPMSASEAISSTCVIEITDGTAMTIRHPENDKLIASFWKIGGVCTTTTASMPCKLMHDQPTLHMCQDTPWSSLRTGGDVSAAEIRSARH